MIEINNNNIWHLEFNEVPSDHKALSQVLVISEGLSFTLDGFLQLFTAPIVPDEVGERMVQIKLVIEQVPVLSALESLATSPKNNNLLFDLGNY